MPAFFILVIIMWFEDLLILLAGGISVFFIGIPGYKLYKTLVPPKRDPLKEAQQRLEQARLDAEAAKLNKETQHLYDQMYTEALEEQDSSESESKESRKL